MLEFRSLASVLTPGESEVATDAAHRPTLDAPAISVPDDVERAASEARFFRAHVREAVDAALATLLTDIACEIVARELQLAPTDVSAIVTAAMQRYDFETPLCVRTHPEDAPGLADVDLPVLTDSALKRGDVLLELRDGAIDLSLGVRLEGLLSARSM